MIIIIIKIIIDQKCYTNFDFNDNELCEEQKSIFLI